MSKNLQEQGLDLSEQTVKAFNLFLFGKIRDMQASFEHLEIYVPKLGLWKARRKRLERYYNIMKGRSVTQLVDDPEEGQRRQEAFERRIEKVRELCDRHEAMILAKRSFKAFRYDNTTDKGGVQESSQDSGGSKKQDLEEGTRREDS